jgi:ATP-dependent DNA ligase
MRSRHTGEVPQKSLPAIEDGWRMLASKHGNDVRLISRDDASLILDGEVAVFDAQLMSFFEWLRQQPPAEASTPPVFIAFDCRLTDKKDIHERPLHVRWNALETLLDDPNLMLPLRRLSDDGLKAWQQVLEHGFEGLVAAGAPSHGSR